MIRATSWKHDDVVDAATALALLDDISITLTRSLDTSSLPNEPRMMQVWYERIEPRQSPAAVVSLDGTVKVSARIVRWGSNHQPNDVLKILSAPLGRILVRVHCSYLLDQKKKPISSTPEVVLQAGFPAMPGGIFESWFFVKGG